MTKKVSIGKIIGATALAVSLTFSSALPALAAGSNGSFETGTDPGSQFIMLSAGAADITDWSIDSGSIDYIGGLWPAAEGSRSLDLNGNVAGAVSQSFATDIGTTYNVTFSLSGNPGVIVDTEDPSWSPTLKSVLVSATGATPQAFTYDTAVKGNTLTDMMWESHEYVFVATATNTTLTFASQIPGAMGPALDNVAIGATPPPPAMVKVTINKFIDGVQATAATAESKDFPMEASWTAVNTGSGSGQYALSASGYNGDPTPYQAKTGDMTTGANYTTSENLTGLVVGASCTEDKPFALVGYTSGNTEEEAAAATPSATAPNLVGITSDKFVIVWNHDCSNTSGTIGGGVTGGASPHGTLEVTSVDAVDTTATADGTFANGWRYVFNITIPDNETGVAMKFADWASTPSGNSIAAANNIRISSAQANNAGATILVTAANTYTTPNLTMTGDLNLSLAGKQVQVTVEVAVPSTTVNGSYTTTYGVRTQ